MAVADTKSDDLHITRIRLENVRGIELIELEPGKVTKLEGKTGTGKTSFREGVRAAFQSKSDRPILVRRGAEEASTIIELSDGTEVERTYTPSGKAPTAKVERDGMRAPKPQALLDELVNPTSFNPVSFLQLSPEQQTEELLRLVPIELDESEWLTAGAGQAWPGVVYGQHALVVLAEIEAAMVAHRRDIGRDAKQHQETGKKLSAEIPAEFDAKAVRASSLRESYDKLTEAQGTNEERYQVQDRLAGLEAEMTRLRHQVAEVEQDRVNARAWLEANPAVDTTALEEAVASHEEQQQVLARYDAMTEAANHGGELQQEYDKWTKEIDRIRALPGELLADAELPVEGMGVDEDGGITIDGLPLAAKSTGEQIRIALDVARATSRTLKVLFVDNVEALDPELQAELIQQAREDPDFQYFISRISGSELEVTDISNGEQAEEAEGE